MIYGLDQFISTSSLKGQVIVLEKTENSDLIEVAKQANKEFFEKVFALNGPFWEVYTELGLGQTPFGADYLVFVNERMYFCKNLEKQFLYSVGPKKTFYFKEGKIQEKLTPSFDNLALLLSTPFDFAKQVSSVAVSAIKINEELQNFEKFSLQSKKFWIENKDKQFENHSLLAKQALEGATLAMKYSFYSSIAYSLKTKLKESSAWKNCELENLSKLALENSLEKIKSEFSFYSTNPYDISSSSFNDEPNKALQFATLKAPQNPAARLRENAKFACARYLAIERRVYLDFAEKTGLKENVFFLNSNELNISQNLSELTEKRKQFFLEILNKDLPKTLVYDKQWIMGKTSSQENIQGISAGGQGIVEGKIVFINTEADYKKDVQGKIVLSKTLSPNLTILFGRIKGIVSESGGRVSHTAIVAIEQNLPCIVQAKNIDLIKEGDGIRLNGVTGKIEKI